MVNYVTTIITIDGSLEDVLSFYERYKTQKEIFSFSKIIATTKRKEIANKLKKQNKTKTSFYDYLVGIYPLDIEMKEINNKKDLPGEISFDTKGTCPVYLINELIAQNKHLGFKINWYSESGGKGEIIGKKGRIKCNKTYKIPIL